MILEDRIVILSGLGDRLRALKGTEGLRARVSAAKSKNSWFTEDNILMAIESITERFLSAEKLTAFVNRYDRALFDVEAPKRVGMVAAGNIPLVGFHDVLCILLSGHRMLLKPSSTDEVLMAWILELLTEEDSRMKEMFLVADKLNGADAYIATGSNNSSRYFHYYFASRPHIIRSNRTSVAVLDGTEDKIQLGNLGNDIFSYFGLGCRNVSKLLVPAGYRFDYFFESIEYWNTIRIHHKYNNNYDYNKSIYLVNKTPHLDNGFLLLKQDDALVSPVGVLYYQEYTSDEEVKEYLGRHNEQIQVVVSGHKATESYAGFGESQSPELDQFADNVDTMAFLLGLNQG